MLRTKKLIVWSLFGAAVLMLTGDLAVAKKPVPPPFAVQYKMQSIVLPEGAVSGRNKMNLAGIVVGRYSFRDPNVTESNGFLYDAETGIACWDLVELVNQNQLVPDGSIFEARDISESGKVVGTLSAPDGSADWAFVLDTQNRLDAGHSSLKLIDKVAMPSASATAGFGVNDLGDVLGSYFDEDAGRWYWFVWNLDDAERCHLFVDSPGPSSAHINNAGQVAGMLENGCAFRYTPAEVPEVEYFPEIGDKVYERVADINDYGVFCGRMAYKPKKGSGGIMAYRCYDTPGADVPQPITDFVVLQHGEIRINSSCDLIVRRNTQGGGPGIYHDSSNYFFSVEDLVDVSDLSLEDLMLWESRTSFWLEDMTDRYPVEDPTTVGRLCASILYPVDRKTVTAKSFVLTPVYPD